MMGWGEDKLALIDFSVAAYMTPFLPGGGRERTWGIIVGPAAVGKTELLRIFLDYNPEKESPRRSVFGGDETANALISGYRSDDDPTFDPSIFAQLDWRRPPVGPKVFIMKEMGPIWGMPREMRSRWFDRMRTAFDGDLTANSGKGGTTYYKLGFGFLGASTEKVDEIKKQDQPLGDRMLLCRMNQGGVNWLDRKSRIRSASRENPYQKEEAREVARATFVSQSDSVIRRVFGSKTFEITHPLELSDKLEDLANLITIVRTIPVSSQILTSAPEEGTRVVKQLTTWGDALATFDDRTSWTEADYALMRRIARDTLPPDFLRALVLLWGGGAAEAEKAKSGEQVRIKGMMGDSVLRQFEQWVLSGLLWEPDGGSYAFTPDAIKTIESCNLFDGLDSSGPGGYSKL
jgi:hypothetical protein